MSKSNAALADTPERQIKGLQYSALEISKLAPAATEGRTATFILSTPDADRAGDSIEASAWNLTAFRKNAIALFNHRSDQPIGQWSKLWIDGQKLMGQVTFADEGVSPIADMVYKMVSAGIIRGASVSFIPKEYEHRYEDFEGGRRYMGTTFKKVDLTEVSVVCVPCNQNALRSKDFNPDSVRPILQNVLDRWDSSPMSLVADKAVLKSAMAVAFNEHDGPETLVGDKPTLIGSEVFDKDGLRIGTMVNGKFFVSKEAQAALAKKNFGTEAPATKFVKAEAHAVVEKTEAPVVEDAIAPPPVVEKGMSRRRAELMLIQAGL